MGTITRGIANNILGSGAVDGTDGLSGTVPANNIANASLNNITSLPPSVDAGIPSVAGNPPSPSDGDVWYNSVTYKLRVQGVSAPGGSWATGGALNTARSGSGFGTQTAAICAGGSGTVAIVESYNGSTWTEVNDLNTARNFGNDTGVGTQSSGMVMGQDDPARSGKTETWNGSSWTEVGDLNTVRRGNGAFGDDATAALTFGGENTSTNMIVDTEIWNGSSWTEVANLNAGSHAGGGLGTTYTAGLAVSGRNLDASPNLTTLSKNESWNGSSWTEVADVNTGTFDMCASGSQTAGLIAGGYDNLAKTEVWNGSAWSEIGDLNTARTSNNGAGTVTSALTAGGHTPGGAQSATEEFTGSSASLDVTLS